MVNKKSKILNKVKESVTPKSRSPSTSGRTTPTDLSKSINKLTANEPKIDAFELFRKERGSLKESLYLVIIGHVDAGKSTLMGHLLYKLGYVNQKLMHKYEQESRKVGKQSFMYAWILDETDEERSRGVTMDIGRMNFETETKIVRNWC